MKHTISDLFQMQSLTLAEKIILTIRRIDQWVEEYGEGGVYVSFSGGKDSTVLLDIVRKRYPNIQAAFVDTGLEYPEIREFVKTFDNVVWIRPKMSFKQVIETYGYPFISKETSECVDGARRYVKKILGGGKEAYKHSYQKLCGLGEYVRKDGKGSGISNNEQQDNGEYP